MVRTTLKVKRSSKDRKHRHATKKSCHEVTKRAKKQDGEIEPAIRQGTMRKVMFKAGTIRLCAKTLPLLGTIGDSFIQAVMQKACCFAANSGRKTVRSVDMISALSDLGMQLHGFEKKKDW